MRPSNLIPQPIKNQLATVATFSFLSDIKSFRTFNGELKRASHGDGPYHVNIRQLGNHAITLRPGTSDARTAFSTFWHKFHMPPEELKMPAQPVFFDLGANNGLTAAHLAAAYPGSKVLAVELDERNFDMAMQNTVAWRDRCTVVHGGVWFEDGEISYVYSEGAEDGFGVGNIEADQGETITVRSCSMNTLFELAGNPAVVDYVKMDIEGAERNVLTRNTDWISRVRSLKIELHEYSHDECIADLKKLGISARPDTHHNLCVVGINDAIA